MQIKIEIDLRPEELRRFLGLPDVSGLQEDVIAFLRDKIGAAGDFDAQQFVRNNIDVLRRNPAWKKLAGRFRLDTDETPAAARGPTGKARRKSAAAPRKRSRKARPAKKVAASAEVEPAQD